MCFFWGVKSYHHLYIYIHIYLVPCHMTPSILVDSKIPSTYPWKIPLTLHQPFEKSRNRSMASMPRAMGPRRRLKFAWRGRLGTVWGNDRKRRFDGIWLNHILGWIYGIVPSKLDNNVLDGKGVYSIETWEYSVVLIQPIHIDYIIQVR